MVKQTVKPKIHIARNHKCGHVTALLVEEQFHQMKFCYLNVL